jgi:DNA-binding CsgD family transcriptional regulator
VERLYHLGEKYTNPNTSKLHFENAVKIIDSSLLTKGKNNNYFLLKKALMLDRLSYYYRKQTNYILSLKTINESLKIKQSIGETYTLCNTYNILARLYHYKKDSVKALTFNNKAMLLAKKHKNDEGIVDALNTYTSYYIYHKDLEKGKTYIDKAYNYADSIGYKKGKALALAEFSGYERRKKNYHKAIEYSKRDLELSKLINHKVGLERSYKALGYAYRKLKQPKKAVFYYEKSLALTTEMGLKGLLANRYLSLSNAHEDLNQYKIALSYYQQYKRQQIKDLKVKNIKAFAKLDAEYAYEKQKVVDSLLIVEKQKVKEAKIIEKASTRFWKFTTIIAIFFGITFTTIIIILKRRREQVRFEKLQNETLQNEINYKKKDLQHLALDITQNKEWALVLAEKLENIKSSTGRKRANELSNLEIEIKNKITVNESTEDFHNKIDLLSSSFYEKLNTQFPKLTKTDIRLCSLIRINMSTKQIAILQNINPSSVKMSRNRLRKKLNLTPSDDLYTFLTSY